MDLVAVGADLRNDPGHGDEDADVDLRGREDEAGPPLPSPGPRLAPAAPPAPRHPVASPDKRQPRPGAFARGPEAALGCVCASKERTQHVAAAPWGAAPWAQSQSTARGGILGGGAHACSGPAAHRGEGAAVPEAHAARLSAPAARRPGDRQRPQHSGLPLLPHVPALLGTCSHWGPCCWVGGWEVLAEARQV